MEIVRTSIDDSRVLQLFAEYDDYIEDFLGEDRIYYTRYSSDEKLETVWLALCEDAPAGVVAYREKEPGVGEVKRLFVKPKYRRHGIGGKLFSEVESHAVQLGCKKLFLDTRATLMPAVSMYQNRGFVEVFRAGLYIQMEKPL